MILFLLCFQLCLCMWIVFAAKSDKNLQMNFKVLSECRLVKSFEIPGVSRFLYDQFFFLQPI